MMYLGDYPTGATVRLPWNTNGADGASITRSTNGTVRIYKDSSTTERTSSAGVTDNEDWDSGITGIHVLTIDLSDNTDASFYAAGHDYMVAVTGQTIDSKTVSVFIGAFSIQNRYSAGGVTPPTAAAIATQVRTELTTELARVDVAISTRLKFAGPAKNTAFAGFLFYLTDSTTNDPLTGKVNADFVIKERSLDGAAFAAGTLGTITEVDNGWYSMDLGAGDLNSRQTCITLQTTDSHPVPISIFPATYA